LARLVVKHPAKGWDFSGDVGQPIVKRFAGLKRLKREASICRLSGGLYRGASADPKQ
jgi:hypothetical protein